jgi:quinol monooxygenase YgiN
MRTALLLAAAMVLTLSCSVRAQDTEPEIITRLKKTKLTGPFTLVVLLKVKEGQEKNLIKAAQPCITATRKEKGCLEYKLQQNLESPRDFVFYERWKSIKDLEEHFQTPHLKKLAGELKELLDGAPRFAVLRVTDKD